MGKTARTPYLSTLKTDNVQSGLTISFKIDSADPTQREKCGVRNNSVEFQCKCFTVVQSKDSSPAVPVIRMKIVSAQTMTPPLLSNFSSNL